MFRGDWNNHSPVLFQFPPNGCVDSVPDVKECDQSGLRAKRVAHFVSRATVDSDLHIHSRCLPYLIRGLLRQLPCCAVLLPVRFRPKWKGRKFTFLLNRLGARWYRRLDDRECSGPELQAGEVHFRQLE